MSIEAAIDYALGVLESAVSADSEDSGPAAVAGLSQRETEVLGLPVEGRSNQEIVAALFNSPHTAANHVAHIMNKLGVDSRTAAAWAVRHGLV